MPANTISPREALEEIRKVCLDMPHELITYRVKDILSRVSQEEPQKVECPACGYEVSRCAEPSEDSVMSCECSCHDRQERTLTPKELKNTFAAQDEARDRKKK